VIKFIIEKIIGTRNKKELKKYDKKLSLINSFADEFTNKSDDELKQRFEEIKNSIVDGDINNVMGEVFALVREASTRVLKLRHYDVQLVGGMVLNDGRIAEMKTGEGKTLVATLPAILNALSGDSVHIVTVNDYLAKRDSKDMVPLYEFFGLSVGVILSDGQEYEDRVNSYKCDIVYGTNNEFGFDYLRDNMKYDDEHIMQKKHSFAIVDEVDSILIDEARTPLIISGPTKNKLENYSKANIVALSLTKDTHFSVDEKNRVILVNEQGFEKAELEFDVKNLYDMENSHLAHHLDQALKANHLFEKDKDYVLQNNEIIIIDEFTGRLSEGRRYSDGLHQALEAKEGVVIQEESQTLADITFQNYFRMYDKLSGMTGTAQTEATEFLEIYNLEVISIPTNVDVLRKDKNDLIFKSHREKFEAVIGKIKSLHKTGQPILVGTASIEQSEQLHNLLKQSKIAHSVLNAKQHTKEAHIIEQAGKKGAVTIATNMAGRGVDIKINREVNDLGGIFILGTERHESRRIDNQLRGRSGRQGDNGESQFYLSLEDSLLRIFGSDKIKNIMEKMGIEDGEHIESSLVTRSVENAQKKVENMNFESRKHLLEFDDVSNEQRKVVYSFRRNIIANKVNIHEKVLNNLKTYLEHTFEKCDILEGGGDEDFDIDKLKSILLEELRLEIEFNEKTYEDIFKKTETIINKQYQDKLSDFSDEQISELERMMYLQTLDTLYREHLYQMDLIKTGIGLRGYNQKDPLTEYKRESFSLFEEFILRSKIDTFKTLFLVQLTREQEIPNILDEVNDDEISLTRSIQQEIKKAKKPPRNSPCPCGSKKKYKHCCGKSGPKVGVLANNKE
jgi:preprotein translocase subunit SecA